MSIAVALSLVPLWMSFDGLARAVVIVGTALVFLAVSEMLVRRS